jgi:hypothetical protein
LFKVEIIRDDHRVELLAELDQLQIHFAHGGKVSLNDLNVERTVVLKPVQHVQASAGRAGALTSQVSQLPVATHAG